MFNVTEAADDVAIAQAVVAARSAELLLPADRAPGVTVQAVGTCEVLLTGAGFYARCTVCTRASGEITHARFRATLWAQAHACGQ